MKATLDKIGTRFWWVIPLFLFDFLYYYFIQYMIDGDPEAPVEIQGEGLAFLFFVSLLSIGCVKLSNKILERFKLSSLPKKYLISIFISFFIFISLAIGVQLIIDSQSSSRQITYLFNTSFIFLFLHLIVGNSAIAVSYFNQSKQLSERLLRLEKVKAEKDLKILQQQMSPHFLFNNLNTLTSLIPIDQEKAISFTRRLASVFRHATDHADKELISLQSEVQFLSDYMELLSYRFGESFQLGQSPSSFDFSGYLSIPMALQVLIENVVKHNVGNKSDPLIIYLKVVGDYLVISNEIRPKLNQEESRNGIGLSNLNQQYELLIGKNIQINTNNNIFSVHLPLIKEVTDEDFNH